MALIGWPPRKRTKPRLPAGKSLPSLALSVRQPWAWAILYGGKVIENRSLGAIKSGGMKPGFVCLHAASGMNEKEYRWGLWRLERHGVACPRPDDLVRGAIIGTIEVTGIITESDSEWFGGEAGLTLANPRGIEPIPAKGALGYFEWSRAEAFAEVKPWMVKFGRGSDAQTGDLFDGAPVQFATPPPKPFGSRKR